MKFLGLGKTIWSDGIPNMKKKINDCWDIGNKLCIIFFFIWDTKIFINLFLNILGVVLTKTNVFFIPDGRVDELIATFQ